MNYAYPENPDIVHMMRTGEAPDTSEQKAVYSCTDCKCDICVDDDYYDIDGIVYCEACMEARKKTADADELDENIYERDDY